MSIRPSWEVYHQLGEKFCQHLEPNFTFQEIGDNLGISKQKAYHECMVALGKLVYGLRKLVLDDLEGGR